MLLPGILLGLLYLTALLAALLATGSPWRRCAAVLVVATSLPLAFFVPAEYPTFTAFLALGCLWFTARVVELARERGSVPALYRLWHAVGMVDTRRARRRVPKVDRSALARMAVGAPLLGAAWAGVYFGSQLLSGAPRLAVRWLCGVVFMYVAVEVTVSAVILVYGLLGIDPRPLHDDPILSKSIGEFWNRRWNRAVHRFLKQNVFAPVARLGHAEWGMVLAFLLSAFIHFYFMWPAVGAFWAGMMALFFLLQLPLLWLERVLGVTRWPAPVARAWTLTLLVLLSPLFVEPVLRIVDTWG
ncbi:MBOAT family protein [Hyalangium rubrum]|uniref:MBOAT family protein n=1 Tax=Hyalangium rubrum TaxID=3103134 RepID=A0ABU5H0L1_9BACT|nr:MBOAT family protein [Hyalangium sp. s54d21]MDY7226856.1 MBOAT family protein [Hyalangium sp. s54d21]